MIPLPKEEATPPVTKIYFVSPTIIIEFNMLACLSAEGLPALITF